MAISDLGEEDRAQEIDKWGEEAGGGLGGGGTEVSQRGGRGTTPETSLKPGEMEGGSWSWFDTLALDREGGGNLSSVQETERRRSGPSPVLS